MALVNFIATLGLLGNAGLWYRAGGEMTSSFLGLRESRRRFEYYEAADFNYLSIVFYLSSFLVGKKLQITFIGRKGCTRRQTQSGGAEWIDLPHLYRGDGAVGLESNIDVAIQAFLAAPQETTTALV